MVELLTKLLMPMRRLQARLKRVQEGSYMVFWAMCFNAIGLKLSF